MKKDNWKFWVGSFVILVLLGGYFYLDYLKDQRNAKEREDAQKALLIELSGKTSCMYERDSLKRINFELAKYESLTLAMVHRDEATRDLKYKVGDIAYLKTDSSRVVVSDVLIGGSKYNYYIRYRVTFSDDTEKEVIPEFLY